jgi:hypothetical protein
MLVRMQRKKEPSHSAFQNVNYYTHYGKQYGRSSKRKFKNNKKPAM